MAGYYNPNLYGNQFNNAGMGVSGAYGFSNGNYPPSPNNFIATPNFAPTQPQIGVQQPQQQVAQGNGSPFIMVPGREAAKEIAVSANQTIYAMSQNAPEFYVKSADNMGLVTTRYFKFAEFDPAIEAAQMQAQAQAQNNAPAGDFVPRSEFNQFVTNVSQELNNLRQNALNAPQNAIVNEPVPVAPVPAVKPAKKTKENPND